MPMIVLFLIIIPNQRRAGYLGLLTIRKRKGRIKMSNEILMSYVGKTVTISTGNFGNAWTRVVVKRIVDNWMEVENKKSTDLINIEFIQSIKVLQNA